MRIVRRGLSSKPILNTKKSTASKAKLNRNRLAAANGSATEALG